MKLYARHSDGTTSQWELEQTSFDEAKEMISGAIESETGSKPSVVLALVGDDFILILQN